MDSWQETHIHSLLGAETENALFSALTHAACELGFDYCAYGLRIPLPISNPKVFMLNNYSQEWQQRYAQENYLDIDPTVAHGKHSVMPLLWSDEVFASCRPFWEEARAHGLQVGWAQSCHDAKGVGGLLSLARSHDDLTPKELSEHSLKMSWLAHAAHEGLSRLLVHKMMPEATVNLSAWEIEVLRWTAEGKTSSEVGDIMHLTGRTVNYHINNALAKLGVFNKTAAAIKAAMLGLL